MNLSRERLVAEATATGHIETSRSEKKIKHICQNVELLY